MPDHVHAVVWFEETEKLSVFMNQWKRRSSMNIKQLFRQKLTAYFKKMQSDDPVCQARYYSFNVYAEAKVKEKLAYMHHNSVKSGLVVKPEDWQFGSA
jgi:putative transposase